MGEPKIGWTHPRDVGYHLGAEPALNKYKEAHHKRQEQYPYTKQEGNDNCKELFRDGYTIIKGGISQNILIKLREEFESGIKNNKTKILIIQ